MGIEGDHDHDPPVGRYHDSDDLDPQPVPEQARCPSCGGEPTDGSVRGHRLSSLGYTHDDVGLVCADCGYGDEVYERWNHGVPIGEPDPSTYEDLRCDSCDAWGLVHFVAPSKSNPSRTFRLLMKCPECYLTWIAHRRRSEQTGEALIGYPHVTGDRSRDEVFE